MTQGSVVERGPTAPCSTTRRHDYTRLLRASVPAGWKPGWQPRRRESVPYLPATEALRLFRSGEAVPGRAGHGGDRAGRDGRTRRQRVRRHLLRRGAGQAAGPRPVRGRYWRGRRRPLEGLPVAVKEEAPDRRAANTLGSLPLRDGVATETAAFAQRILDAGGIVHARTTTPEFCCAPVTWTKLWGVTRNPWNLTTRPAARAAARRRRWPPARRRWPPAPTSAGRSGSRPRSAA